MRFGDLDENPLWEQRGSRLPSRAYPLGVSEEENGSRAGEQTAGLLARARRGEQKAFDRMFARALPRLEWFIGLRLGSGLQSRLETADVVQESYGVAWEKLSDFEARGEGSFVRWLCAIAGHQILRLAAHHGAQRRAGPTPGAADQALALARDPASGP